MAFLLNFTDTMSKGISTGKLKIAIKLMLLLALEAIALIKHNTPENAEELNTRHNKNIGKFCTILPTNHE